MKILHVLTGFAITYPGGITNYVRSLTREQTILGNMVDVLSGEGVDKSSTFFNQVNEIIEIKVMPNPFSLSIMRKNNEVVDSISNVIVQNNYDIIHFHAMYGIPQDFLKKFSKLNIKYVVSLHDYGCICPRIFMINKKQKVCLKRKIDECRACIGLFEQNRPIRVSSQVLNLPLPSIKSTSVDKRNDIFGEFLLKASRVLAVSTKVANIYQEAIPKLSCDVLHIGNDSAIEGTERGQSKEKTKNEKIKVCFLGTMTKIKGAEVFSYYAKRLPRDRFELKFFGKGDKKYIKLIESLGVDIGGTYTPNMLSSILSNVDLGMVLPVWNDNAPQVLMELLNNKVPVFATSMGGIPDFIDKKTGFLIDPYDKKSFEDGLEWLLSLDKKKLNDMSANIIRLKKPREHAIELNEIYKTCLQVEKI